MSRRIDIEVTRRGEIRVEFSGFPGESCFEEAELLAKALRELGLWAIPVSVHHKSSSEIARETEEREPTKEKVPPI